MADRGSSYAYVYLIAIGDISAAWDAGWSSGPYHLYGNMDKLTGQPNPLT